MMVSLGYLILKKKRYHLYGKSGSLQIKSKSNKHRTSEYKLSSAADSHFVSESFN